MGLWYGMKLADSLQAEKDVVTLKDSLGSTRLNRIYILYYFLRDPFVRLDTYEISKVLRIPEITIRNNINRLVEKGLVVRFNVKDKKWYSVKLYHIPANMWEQAKVLFFAELMKHLYDWRSTPEKNVWAWENWGLFRDVELMDGVSVFEERLRRQKEMGSDEGNNFMVEFLEKEKPV